MNEWRDWHELSKRQEESLQLALGECAELSSSILKYNARIAELEADLQEAWKVIGEKNARIAELERDFQADTEAADAVAAEQRARIAELEALLREMRDDMRVRVWHDNIDAALGNK